MPILQNELKLYGSAVMPDDDTVLAIGGAIDTAKKVEFTDVIGSIQAVSSNAGDTTQTVTVHYRDTSGALLNQVVTLAGQSPVAFGASVERILKALKSASTAGDVAVEAATAERTGTAQGGDANAITLDAGASAVNDFYNGMIIRLTSGNGNGQIRQIIAYDGTTKKATVNASWSTNPDATSVFRIAKGVFFDKTPSEVTQVRRPFYNAAANPPGGAEVRYYDKTFFKNTQPATGGLTLTTAQVIEQSDPSGLIAFGLAATLNDSGTNGAGNNRKVAPSGITFDSATKNVANSGSLTGQSGQGTWLELVLAGGAAALKTTYTLRLQGNTV